jgi:hypothetical protein
MSKRSPAPLDHRFKFVVRACGCRASIQNAGALGRPLLVYVSLRWVGLSATNLSGVATIELTPTSLVVHITGADQFFALASRLEVPLEHIAGVDSSLPEAHSVFKGLRMGTNVPGLITAGRFLHHGQWAFWDVHDPDRAIGIRLHDEHYAKLIVGVDNPQLTAELIGNALRRRG